QDDFPASVREIVMSGCIKGAGKSFFFGKADRDRADEYMRKMDIKDLEKECYADLSGGQRQRVLIARALCATDRLLLMDEPVSGLDPDTTEEMYSIVEELNKNGTTIIMISHDVDNAMKYADHVLVIDDNVFFGTVDEYLETKGGEDNGGDL
ncbi:MAG: ATP-binding cassette domain-containing protein, partial [Lachnospiraceae bacterium]|nr:ATP-binding cassette domain-containing protein [Lachnospiraceae bacterium]